MRTVAPTETANGSCAPAPLRLAPATGLEPDLGAAIIRLCEVQEAVLEKIVRLEQQLAPREALAAPSPDPAPAFRRDGKVWEICYAGVRFRLPDSKGLGYIAHLLACPGAEVHALELACPGERPSGEAGDELIDGHARASYQRRLAELSANLDEARAFNDHQRVARVRVEMDWLTRELSAAVGLRGRPRRSASAAERARQSVTKAIRAAQSQIADHSPALAQHLAATIRTGTFCIYLDDPRSRPAWQLGSVDRLPAGRVTMLFTDIEGSTRLILEYGERLYAQRLSEHQRRVRTVVREHGGVEFGTQGDAFFIAFADARDAVAAGAALVAMPAGPFRIRIGIHSGVPQCLGDDYTGIDVCRTARICAAAHGGQVVLSDDTRALLDDGFTVTPLGDHSLKGLPRPERLFQLGGAHFPALRSLPSPVRSLPCRGSRCSAAASAG